MWQCWQVKPLGSGAWCKVLKSVGIMSLKGIKVFRMGPSLVLPKELLQKSVSSLTQPALWLLALKYDFFTLLPFNMWPSQRAYTPC